MALLPLIDKETKGYIIANIMTIAWKAYKNDTFQAKEDSGHKNADGEKIYAWYGKSKAECGMARDFASCLKWAWKQAKKEMQEVVNPFDQAKFNALKAEFDAVYVAATASAKNKAQKLAKEEASKRLCELRDQMSAMHAARVA